MNIFDLNKLISAIENGDGTMKNMLPFYRNMKKDLMKKLSTGIQEIINQGKK